MSKQLSYAHSGRQSDRSDWQLLQDHLEGTATLAAERGAVLGLRAAAHMAGLFHDFGKHDPDFDRVLRNEGIRVDHSTAGAKLLLDLAPPGLSPCAEVLAYAILGHHAGLPDRQNATAACLDQRIKSFRSPISNQITAEATADFLPVLEELKARMRPGLHAGFDLSVAARMIFSCLVDADYRDTEAFYDQLEGRDRPRSWSSLAELLPEARAAFDAHMSRFSADTDLNRLRSDILVQVRSKAQLPPGLFTLTVPTGGGKTLASMGFALDHAAAHGHRRIIYAIPYTSIIDQTAQTFREMFGEIVLEHHSSIDEDRPGAEQRDKLRLAMEDWASPIVVTTNVQLFESLFAARPSRCRKVHNIAGSVIVLDEAQCLPRNLLLPALRMIDTLATHYGCTVILCTATQPAFDSRQLKSGGLPLEGRELAPDPIGLSRRLRRARIVQGGAMDDDALVAALEGVAQGLVIVNSRSHALELFREAVAAGLDGVLHLTTRQYPAHRRRIVEDIRRRLKAGEPCRLIATSLIEAGVDLDFPLGWRAEGGLDSIIQAAGRVNREGRRPVETSILTVFSVPDHPAPTEVGQLARDMRAISAAHPDDLMSPCAITDYFGRVYWRVDQKLDERKILGKVSLSPTGGASFAFREIADDFRMIDSAMVPVIIARDDQAQNWIAKLGVAQVPSGRIARALQSHVVQIPEKARNLMIANGHAAFHAPHLRADQFCVLETASLYTEDCGLIWEQADFLSADQALI